MEIKDFKVGQRVWVKLTGNASRGKSGNDLIEEWGVVSVGRKYVKAKKVGYSHSWEIEFEKREYSERFVQKTNTCVDYGKCATSTRQKEYGRFPKVDSVFGKQRLFKLLARPKRKELRSSAE